MLPAMRPASHQPHLSLQVSRARLAVHRPLLLILQLRLRQLDVGARFTHLQGSSMGQKKQMQGRQPDSVS